MKAQEKTKVRLTVNQFDYFGNKRTIVLFKGSQRAFEIWQRGHKIPRITVIEEKTSFGPVKGQGRRTFVPNVDTGPGYKAESKISTDCFSARRGWV